MGCLVGSVFWLFLNGTNIFYSVIFVIVIIVLGILCLIYYCLKNKKDKRDKLNPTI
jgi:hypothetical protein